MSNPWRGHPFPSYYRHSEASCFNCGGDFGDGYPHDSGNAPGDGKWAQDCEKCRMTTYYDLERDPDEERELRAERRHDHPSWEE